MAVKKKRTGLPKKYAKMGFAKGWAAYKKAKKAAAAKRKKTAKKTVKKKPARKKAAKKAVKKKDSRPATKRAAKKAPAKKKGRIGLAAHWIKKAGGDLAKAWRLKKRGTTSTPKKRSKTTMAKKKKSTKRGGSRAVKFLSPATMTAVTSAAWGGGGVIAGTAATNMLPVIKDQRTMVKALVQLLIGLMGINFSRNKQMKMVFSGVTLGSLITALYPYLPANLKLAGRDFSPNELRELATLGIIDEDTDVAGVLDDEDEMGIIDEDTDMAVMGKGRFHPTAIDIYD